MATITLRTVQAGDYHKVLDVEARSTPGLRYLPDVFDLFRNDASGGFFLAERDGQAIACAKFTLLPDGTAWLETLRVIPEVQGQGVGKLLYGRYLELARQTGVTEMRMYTGVNNAASKTLAERFGFEVEQTFLGFSRSIDPTQAPPTAPQFEPVLTADASVALLQPHAPAWGNFLVMNRTFYRLTNALCSHIAGRGEVFRQRGGHGVLVLGARFAAQRALHIGLFAGDADASLTFAVHLAMAAGVPQLHCLFPSTNEATRLALMRHGFTANPAPYIVMKRVLNSGAAAASSTPDAPLI